MSENDIRNVRSQPKDVRFCPSCGYRVVIGKALHYGCRVCEYVFYITPAENIRSHVLVQTLAGNATFQVISDVTVSAGRVGVKELLTESGVGSSAVTPPEKDVFN